MPKPKGIRFEIDISEVDKKLREFVTKYPETIQRIMYEQALVILVPAMREHLKVNKSIWRGELFQRINVQIVQGEEKFPAVDVGAIGVPYAWHVEKGQPPHSEDLDKMTEYIKAKHRVDGDIARRMAAAALRTLEAVGSKPHPYIVPAWEETKAVYSSAVFARIAAEMPK